MSKSGSLGVHTQVNLGSANELGATVHVLPHIEGLGKCGRHDSFHDDTGGIADARPGAHLTI